MTHYRLHIHQSWIFVAKHAFICVCGQVEYSVFQSADWTSARSKSETTKVYELRPETQYNFRVRRLHRFTNIRCVSVTCVTAHVSPGGCGDQSRCGELVRGEIHHPSERYAGLTAV